MLDELLDEAATLPAIASEAAEVYAQERGTLVAEVNEALYEAKDKGRNRVVTAGG